MTKKDRNAEMQRRIYRFVQPLPLGQASKKRLNSMEPWKNYVISAPT